MENTTAFDSTRFRVAMTRHGSRPAVELARLCPVSPSYVRRIPGGFVPRPEIRERYLQGLRDGAREGR